MSWPPKPDEEREYTIGSLGSIQVKIKGVPPCLWCGEPVLHESMDGPLVCPACDCGNNKDGSKWSTEEYQKHRAHLLASVAKYRELTK